jgi:hypothetical protein
MDEIEGRVACVTFAEPPMLRGFERKLELPYPVWGDPGRASYRAMGFERASWRRVWLDPRVWARYARLLARGRRTERSGQDELQLGGDVVLDAAGRLAWIYRSEGPDDRPGVEALVGAVREAAASDRAG